MKIIACLASRERPAAMIGVVMALHRMRSAKHELDFVLGLDNDDETAPDAVKAFAGELEPVVAVGDSPLVRGQIENRMLAAARDLAPDAVTLVSDRTFNITPAWDEWIARAVAFRPDRTFWWQCPEDPGCIIPIAQKRYLDAIDWKWSPEIFPFWWDDTWHQEIDLLLHGFPSAKARCTYSGARGKTANGREFAFWLDVFIKTRPRRREQAQKIAAALGIELKPQPQAEQYFVAYDKNLTERCPDFEGRFGDPRPPSQNYLTAKANAEKLLSEVAAQ